MRKWMLLVAAGAMLAAATPALAWGPRTQITIVTSAANLITKESGVGLNRMAQELQAGAMVPYETLSAQYPELPDNPLPAIESEMFLLQAVRGDRVDPYFAYRLGTLGKIVAEATAPLRAISATYRNLYYSDVEANINNLSLEESTRRTVEPRMYFERVMLEAAVNDELIEREYQSGVGFAGAARAMLMRDAGRSVTAVADVWHTALTGSAISGNVSENQLRRYVVDAHRFYIARKNDAEIDAAILRLEPVVPKTLDMREQIGDMFYEAEMFERAMAEYQAIIALEPQRRNVVEKMAEYYVRQGEQALKDQRLEEARDAFAAALAANPLHPAAEGMRLQAETQIAERDARMQKDQTTLAHAGELQTMAEQEASRSHYAEAIVFLRQAQDAYTQVSTEFPAENQKRMQGTEDVRIRLHQLQQDLMANAQVFSGSGYIADAQTLAQKGAAELDRQGLEQLLQAETAQQFQELEQELADTLEVK
jgi:tetratricopeptide (TPR) repeat protein